MFKCNDCGCIFEEPETTREFHGLDYGYENQFSCPNCGGTDYEDSQSCEICGEEAWGDCFCENCINEARLMLKVDFGHFPTARMESLTDLFAVALDKIYVDERMAKKK